MTGFTPDAPVLHEIKNHSEALAQAEAGVAAMAAERNNRWYPKFHIASNGGWINDPNGLCFYKARVLPAAPVRHPVGSDALGPRLIHRHAQLEA